MAKTTYRKVKRGARKNPTLLTLVNPSKSPRKKPAKSAAQLRKQKKKVTPKKRAETQTLLRGEKPVGGAQRRPAARKVGGRSYLGGTKGLRSGQKPKKPGFKGRKGDVVPARRAGPGAQSYTTPGGRKSRRSKPDAGWNWVEEHDRAQAEDGVSGYWRFLPNEGEDMYGRRRIRRRRRAVRNARPMRRSPRGRFVGRRVRRAAPMRRNKPAKRKPARKKAARKTTRKTTRKKTARKTTRRKTTKRKARRNPRRRVVRYKGKRYTTRRNKRRTVRRRRRYAKKNPIPMMAKQIGVGFVGFLAGRLTANMLTRAQFIPENIRPYSGLLGTTLGVALAYYLPKKFKSLKDYQQGLILGTGIAMADVLFSSFAPENIRAYVGAPQPVMLPGAMGADLNVYEAALRGWGGPPVWLDESGDWGQKPMLPGRGYAVSKAMAGMGLDVQEALAEYVQEPMGEYVQEPMGEYIEEPLGMDEDGALVTGNEELDAGVVSDSLFGNDEDIDILALDDVPFEGDRAAAVAANAAAKVANTGARAGRPVQEIVAAANNAACQVMGASQLSAMVRKMVAAEVAKAVGRVQSFAPQQDPVMGAPMAVGPIRTPKREKWTYGSINESGGIFGKGPFG